MPDQIGERPAFGVALDAYRPGEILGPPGAGNAQPPWCPVCTCILQEMPDRNDMGDKLFSCLGEDGYEAVWRIAVVGGRKDGEPENTWVPRRRPGMEATYLWRPPLTTHPAQKMGDQVDRALAATEPLPTRPARTRRTRAAEQPVAPKVALPDPVVTEAPVKVALPPGVEWLSLADAAAVSGTSANALYQRVKRGTLQATRIDGKVMVRDDQLVEGA